MEPRWLIPQGKTGSLKALSEEKIGGVRAPSSEPSLSAAPSVWRPSKLKYGALDAGGADTARTGARESYQLEGAVVRGVRISGLIIASRLLTKTFAIPIPLASVLQVVQVEGRLDFTRDGLSTRSNSCGDSRTKGPLDSPTVESRRPKRVAFGGEDNGEDGTASAKTKTSNLALDGSPVALLDGREVVFDEGLLA